jgi:transcriptional regulator with XRE-family HTH domain
MDTSTGERLAALRHERGLSQEDLAAQLGVSRQAVSNWERCESLPDSGNLIALSRLYGITVDEIISSRSVAEQEGDSSIAGEPSNTPRDWQPVALIACAALTAAYYALIALPLARSTVNDVAEVFGLPVGPALAITWFTAEVVFVLVPFILIAIAPAALPRWAWAVPLTILALPAVASLGYSLLAGSAALDYSGIGGALMPSIALKADLLAALLGCTLVHVVRGRRTHPARASAMTMEA